jgi:hypothetical protein
MSHRTSRSINVENAQAEKKYIGLSGKFVIVLFEMTDKTIAQSTHFIIVSLGFHLEPPMFDVERARRIQTRRCSGHVGP